MEYSALDLTSLTCARCGAAFAPKTGRGVQSKYCPACRAIRRRQQAELRSIRHAMAQMDEWTEALGPRIVQWKEEVNQRQNGRCRNCGNRRKLYFALDDDDSLYGLCLPCHQAWSAARKEQK